MTIQSAVQRENPGAIVTLFRIDATPVGGPVMFFCRSAEHADDVRFGGQPYTPVDVEFSGFETNGNGALPQPKMRLANTNGVIQDIVNAYGDLLGCTVARVRTFAQFLDGHPEADPNVFFGPDVFRVEQKTSENKLYIEWSLSASIDQEGKNLPGRLVLRDNCMWRYRTWDAAANAFTYDPGSHACPYAGQAMFDRFNQPTQDPTKDACSQILSGCQTRFGKNVGLPYGGFPGVARTQTPTQ